MKKLTREERRRRSQRRLQLITYLLFLLFLLAWLLPYMVMTVEAEPAAQYKAEIARDNGSLLGDDTPAISRCYLTEAEQEAAENELIGSRFAGPVSQVGRCHHHLLLLRGTASHLRDWDRHHRQRTARDSVCELRRGP